MRAAAVGTACLLLACGGGPSPSNDGSADGPDPFDARGDGDGRDDDGRDGDGDNSTDGDGRDGGPAREIARIDWSAARGPALAAERVLVEERDVFAVHAGGFVTARGCDDAAGCELEWFDAHGGALAARARLAFPYATTVSPDARALLGVDADATGVCEPDGSVVVDGRLELVDLASGAVLVSEAQRTNRFLAPAFSASGAWFRSDPIPGGACGADLARWRAVASPRAPAPILADPSVYLLVELPGGRWAGYRGQSFGVADALATTSAAGFEAWSEAIDGYDVAGGWLHAYDGYGDTTERVWAKAPDGRSYTKPVSDDRLWRGHGDAWGRFAVVCLDRGSARLARACEVLDVTGALPARPIEIADAADRLAFLGGGAALAVKTLDAGGAVRVERLDLASGARAVVHAGDGALLPLGDGAAAILHHAGGALLVEADREEALVDGPLDQVLTLPPDRTGARRPVRQASLAVIVQATDVDRRSLLVFDLETRRLATLTDRLYFAPHRDDPFAYGDCGQPWTLRSAGQPFEQLAQQARWMAFLEVPDPAGPYPVFVVPADLSAPPRRLGDVEPNPVHCHAPLASPDGSLVVLDVDRFDGVSTLTIARP
jgi:hypothetical protein